MPHPQTGADFALIERAVEIDRSKVQRRWELDTAGRAEVHIQGGERMPTRSKCGVPDWTLIP
jgi:hypothetical protein